ncbi:hypothetical protein [Thermaurantiacus sp.]
MRRAWLHLLVLLGLAAAAMHAPAMALPEPAAPAAAVHADCHADMAPAPDEPSCCPDGCYGGCLLSGAMILPRGLAHRLAARAALPLPGVAWPAQRAAESLFHPPRPLA